MRARWRSLRYSGLLTQSGIHVVAYRRGARGFQVVRAASDLTRTTEPVEAIYRLGNLLEGQGARGARVALAIGGFGSCHHLLTLPSAPKEILAPVVARELRRFYPALFEAGLDDPVTEFVEHASAGEGRSGQQELLAAALPRSLVRELLESLGAREMVLEHLTILPRTVQHLYEAFAEPEPSTAALLMLPNDPLLGLFYQGELRLFSQPMLGEHGSSSLEAEVVAEQVERGALFIRQQFRGAAVERVLLSVEPAMREALAAELQKRLNLPVERFSVYDDSPGSMAALGAALDAASELPFNLLPAALRSRSSSAAWVRRLAVATAAVLVAVGGGAALIKARSADREEARVRALARAVERRSTPLAQIQPVVRERQAHVQRSAVLADLSALKQQIPGLLFDLQNAPAGVRLDSLSLARGGGEVLGLIEGVSLAATSARAADAIEGLYRSLGRDRLPGSVVVRSVGAVDAAADQPEIRGVAIRFVISVVLQEDAS